MQDLLTLRDWLAAGRRVALATVVSTWGSSPRPVGSQMLVDAAGDFSGSVSGGCVEAAVITEAGGALADGMPRDLSYGVDSDTAWAVGLPCGGTIRVYVEPVPAEALPAIEAILEFGQAWRRTIRLSSAEPWSFTPANHKRRQSWLETTANAECFHQLYADPPRLIVVGAVHIAQSLLVMAGIAGFETVLVDPRSAFASETRFAGQTMLVAWPEAAMAELQPDERTAIVTLSHKQEIDDAALIAGLNSPAFYLAALGSRKNQAGRRERLAAAGFDKASLARLHGPAGLAIGALTPEEIAVSILAEMIAAWRQATA